MTIAEARAEIENLIVAAHGLIPDEMLEMLPPEKDLLGAPGWRSFENQLWQTGERIRAVLLKYPRLRADGHVQSQILEIACDRRAHRGRQSFVMLLGFRCCRAHAGRLADHLDDACVDGHVIKALCMMRAPGYSSAIQPFATHEKTWIRNLAKKYLAWDANA